MPTQRQPTKARGYCFTINNPEPQDSLDLENLREAAAYVIYGQEVGEEGTPHYQGYCYFQFPVSFTRVKSILQRAHIEAQRGSIQQAIAYCEKDGLWQEFGERPGQKRTSKEQWTFCIEAAERGDLESIKSEYPGMYVRYLERWRSLRRRDRRPMDGDLTHEWWVGPTGSGKSRHLWSMYPTHYAKELNKWWDGYEDQEVVAIEEWCPKNECTASFLKIWADRYPFPAQIKGGNLKNIRPRKIIVLSNYELEQCFPNVEDLDPMKRRFQVVRFPLFFETFNISL